MKKKMGRQTGRKMGLRTASLLLALAMAAAFIPVSANALVGEGSYAPAESNIAVKYWVTASADVGADTAAYAIDGNPATAWAPGSYPATLTVDLGGAYDAVYKTKILFASASAAPQYSLEGSTDGATWTTLSDRLSNAALAGGFTDVFKLAGLKHIRLTVNAADPAGVAELEIVNYLRENMNNGSDTSGFTSNTTYYNANGEPPAPEGIRNGGVMTGDPETDPGFETGDNFFGLTKDLGWDTIRLRIWNEPKSEGSGNPSSSCSPENTRLVAKYINAAGQDLAIDFHYADSWSDPQNQPKPYAWAELPFESDDPETQDLIGATYDFTYEMIKSLIDQGTAPTIIALGNEISNGMMWGGEYDLVNPFADYHHYYNTYIRDNPDAPLGGGVEWINYANGKDDVNSAEYQSFLASITRLAKLVDAGQRAINKLNDEYGLDIQTEMHFAFNVFERPPQGQSGDKIAVDPDEVLAKVQTLVFGLRDNLEALNADGQSGMTDRVGISYYPDWHGTYQNVQRNIVELSKELPGVEFNIAECSPRASGTITNDGIGWMANPNVVRNPMNDDPALPDSFEFTPQWQGDDTVNIMQMINDVPNNVGMGVWPWNGQSVYFANRATRVGMLAFKDSFAKNVLESSVFVTIDNYDADTAVKPATVADLDIATGIITAAPVAWDAEPAARSDMPGYAMYNGVAETAGNSKAVKLYVSTNDQAEAGIYAPDYLDKDASSELAYTISSSNVSPTNLINVSARFDAGKLSYVNSEPLAGWSFIGAPEFDAATGEYKATLSMLAPGTTFESIEAADLLRVNFVANAGAVNGTSLEGMLASARVFVVTAPGGESTGVDAMLNPAVAATNVITMQRLDFNGDGRIGLDDLSTYIYRYYLAAEGDDGWDASGDNGWAPAKIFDLNGDMEINVIDVLIFYLYV